LIAVVGSAAPRKKEPKPAKAPKRTGSDSVVVHSPGGTALLRVDGKDRRGVTLTLFHKGGGSRAEAEAALRDLLDNHWPQ